MHELFGNNLPVNARVMKLKRQQSIILSQPSIDSFAGKLFIKGMLIANNDIHHRAVVALQNKLFGQCIKINVVEAVPHAQKRNQILRPDFFRNPATHEEFIGEAALKRRGVIKL